MWPLCPLSKAVRGRRGPETVTVARINPTRRPVLKQAGTLGLTQSGEGEDKETQCQGMAVISWLQACDVSTQPQLKDLMQKQFESERRSARRRRRRRAYILSGGVSACQGSTSEHRLAD